MSSIFHPAPETQPQSSPRLPMRSGARRRRLWRFARLALLVCALVAVLCALLGWTYLDSLPSVSDAEQRVDAIVLAHHGTDMGMPPPQKVGEAIVAVEDSRFYTNHGIDAPSMLHFAWGYITTGSTTDAGATITEQLVKILYIHDPTTLAGKVEMLGLALKMNQRYTKPEILSMYLDAIYYGHQAWGIAQASQTYFHTAPDQLTWGEASMLAGLPQAPSVYDPYKRYDLARERQQHVLARLVATGVLTQTQASAAYAETPRLP